MARYLNNGGRSHSRMRVFDFKSGNCIIDPRLLYGDIINIERVSTEKRFNRIISCREYRDPFI